MNIKVDFDNIVVKEDKNDFIVKILMLKGEKGDSAISKTSELINDSGFITKEVNDLTNYYKKTETYSKTETNNLLNNKVDNSELGNYYETSEVDDLLTNKADNSVLDNYYTKAETYNQNEINSLIDGKADQTAINTINSLLTTKANTSDVESTYETIANHDFDINSLRTEISSLASGSPLVASSVSGMTDTTKVYVNTTDGEWYYYNGSNWVSGGVYQSSRDNLNVENGLYGQLYTSLQTNDLTYRYNSTGQQNGSGVVGTLYETRTISADANNGYSFVNYNVPTNKIYLTFELNDISKFKIYGRRNSSNSQDLTNYIKLGDKYASIIDPELINSNITSIQVRFDNRQGTEPLVLSHYMATNNHIYSEVLNKIDTQINDINKVVYVNVAFQGTSDGTASKPYKTIQEAINSNADTIRIYPGEYKEDITVTNKKKLYLENIIGGYYSGQQQQKVRIIAGESLTFNQNNNLMEAVYSADQDTMLYKCFVSQIEEIEDTTSPRSKGYKCNLWYIDNLGTTIKLTPKLTMAECQATENSWYFDGTSIFANTTHSNLVLCNGDLNCGLRFEECSDIHLSGIVINYSNNFAGLYIKRCENVLLDNCEVNYSSLGNGFYGKQSNIIFNNCKAIYNRNDGFNFDDYGSTIFNDCKGLYNFDDGVSHHGGCVGSIYGGEFAYNHKGGISPVYLSHIDIYDAYSHNNTYGLLGDGTSDDIIFNSVFKSNGLDVKLTGNRNITIHNTIYNSIQKDNTNVITNLDN